MSLHCAIHGKSDIRKLVGYEFCNRCNPLLVRIPDKELDGAVVLENLLHKAVFFRVQADDRYWCDTCEDYHTNWYCILCNYDNLCVMFEQGCEDKCERCGVYVEVFYEQ